MLDKRMKHRTAILTSKQIWLSAMVLFTTIVVIVAIILIQPTRATGADTVDCSGNWYNSPDTVLKEACSKQKDTNHLTDLASEEATTLAQPRVPSVPNAVQTVADYPSEVMLPMPDYAKPVHEYTHNPYDGPPPSHWKGYTSAWVDSGVPDSGYTYWSKLYVLARSGRQDARDIDPDAVPTRISGESYPRLNTDILDGGGPGMGKYLKGWTCPQPIGDIVITNITNPPINITDASTPYPGLQSVVYFKAKNGQTGNFNMATETWTFDPAPKSP